MLKRVIGIILIVSGLAVIGAALYMRISTNMIQKKMVNDFEKTIQMDENTNSAGSKQPGKSSDKDKSVSSGTIGIITIPRIELKAAVSEGTDLKTLKYAVGHFKGTAMPGEIGNSCFAGHRSYTYGQFFNRLDEMQMGDEIIIETKKGKFVYKVSKKEVVLPNEVSVLDKTSDAEITLVTCTPLRVGTHRLIIKGTLQK